MAASDGTLFAFAVGCASGGGTCTPLWTASFAGHAVDTSPAVANGVVYVGSDDGLRAYATGCNSGGGACLPIWTFPINSGYWTSPAVSNGVLYAASDDGSLYAFGLNPDPAPSATASPSPSEPDRRRASPT